MRWERENDAHYPRDKYRDIKEYFGTRYLDPDLDLNIQSS